MAIKDIPASTILDIQNLIAQVPSYIGSLVDVATAKAKIGIKDPGKFSGQYIRTAVTPSDFGTAAKQLLDWFNSTIKPNATSTKDAKATISSTFTSVADFNSSFFNIRTAVMLADPTAVAFLDTWFAKYSKITATAKIADFK
jgi:hypothetical protein